MASLDDLKKRIASVKSTQKITKAMKMVAAAKLRRAQESAEKGRPYSEKMNNVILNLSNGISDKENAPKLLSGTGQEKTHLCVVMTSDRGLCGGFNSNIIKEVNNIKATSASKRVDLLTIGKKGDDILSKKFEVISSHNDVYDNFNYNNIKEIAETVMQKFSDKEYDEVTLVYNHFKNAATQIVTKEQYLPIEESVDQNNSVSGDYIFEPNRPKILNELIPKSLSIQLFKAISDSIAGEHGARMTAMHKATDNASELRDQLKLTYNKARQTAITNEILEIVGGAEALNS